MKTLLLLRHANAASSGFGAKDHDRPLNNRGQDEARAIGDYLTVSGYIPKQILCSSARRAQETLQQLRLVLPDGGRIDLCDDLYLAEPHQISARINDADQTADTVLIISHNPGLDMLVRELIENDPDPYAIDKFDGLVTAALAIFSSDTQSWPTFKEQALKLDRFVCPDDLSTEA